MTGSTGFIGRNLTARLERDGHEVFALKRGDDVLKTVREARPEVTYHLASLFLAENTYEQVKPLIESNLLLGAELADALTRENCPALVAAGTAWQNFAGKKGTASCLYAATKESFESLLRYYGDALALRSCVLKLYDTYGPGDTRRKLLNVMREAARTKTPIGMSPGEQKIELLHVSDAVEAFLIAGERVRRPGPGRLEEFYLRTGRALTLRELAGVVFRFLPLQANFGERPYRAREVMEPWSEGEVLPGWTPKIALEDGLKDYFLEGMSRA